MLYCTILCYTIGIETRSGASARAGGESNDGSRDDGSREIHNSSSGEGNTRVALDRDHAISQPQIRRQRVCAKLFLTQEQNNFGSCCL